MKTPQKLRFGASSAKDKKGVALVTVLTVMALTTILVLTFFSLATSEHRASNTYSQGLHAQQVAEQAVNMVIAQIREATADPNDPDEYAWASQPGAIRRWDMSGGLDTVFKLYSDDMMRVNAGVTSADDLLNDFNELALWDSEPDLFVDLNEPVIRGEKVYYPIVNPTASVLPQWPNRINGESEGVEGFSYDATLVPSGEFGQKAAQVAQASDGHLAMPVKWLYQLEDGTLGVLLPGGSRESGYQFNAISGTGTPTADNQIVSRFAFWADDETSKLNLNTHAGGLAWDIPKAGGEIDMDMGRHQPAQNEWQRYPGHPATTHIAPALSPGVRDIVFDRQAMEMLFDVVPRVVGGGSESGTRALSNGGKFRPEEENGLIPDNEPLFPSLDDMVMRADRSPHEYPDPTGNPIPASELSEYLERAKFFITTYSRAPEVSIFNVPKVAIWPLHNTDRDDSDYDRYLTPFDQLIHYCASVGVDNSGDPFEYVFKREQADSPTNDFEGIRRNRELFEYLSEQMGRDIPGYGASFRSKYGAAEVEQILTLIFDYIRSTNLHDDTLFGENFEDAFLEENTDQHVTYTNPRDFYEKGFGHKGHGQVTPIEIGDSKGLGRFFSLASAGIVVGAVAEPLRTPPFNDVNPAPPALYPGVGGYQNFDDPASGVAYLNFPPAPDVVDPEEPSTWPQWLTNLPADQQQAALRPENWNWNLMFLSNSLNLKSNLKRWRDEKFTDGLRNDGGYSAEYRQPQTPLRLQGNERLVQASIVFNLFSPSIGWTSINPDMEIYISAQSGMTFEGGTVEFLGFQARPDKPVGQPNQFIWATNWAKPLRTSGARAWGGLLSFGYTMTARQANQEGRNPDTRELMNPRNVWNRLGVAGETLYDIDQENGGSPLRSRLTPLDKGYEAIPNAVASVDRNVGGNAADVAQSYRYDLVTVPFKVSQNVRFDGGQLNFMIHDGGDFTEDSASDDGDVDLVQDITLDFPSWSLLAPFARPGHRGHVNEFGFLGQDTSRALDQASMTADPANIVTNGNAYARLKQSPPFDVRGTAGSNAVGRMTRLVNFWDNASSYIHENDIVQAVGVPHGDMRLVAAQKVIGAGDTEFFAPHRDYGNNRQAHSFTNSVGRAIAGFDPNEARHERHLILPDLKGVRAYWDNGRQVNRPPYNRQAVPLPFFGTDEGQRYGDFDNGAGTMIDGPYINKPDEGNVHSLKTRFEQTVFGFWERKRDFGEFPYFSNPENAESGGPAYFSPNRIVSGPGMFGSLPTGVRSGEPWQTLLFRPNVVGNGFDPHPGAEDPPDHLIMDMFWMPVVEPYAISEPLSTAGKVNMNYEMMPFMHVKRNTALRGVFRSEYMVCIPVEWHAAYKLPGGRGRGIGYHWRDDPRGGNLQGKKLRSVIQDIDTLQQFDDFFNNGAEVFKTASQICEIHLIPQELNDRLGQDPRQGVGSYTPTVDEMENGSYWKDHALVGDNSRERPYTNLQQRLTTKSNTFKVHYRAQVVKQARRDDDDYSTWRPLTDSVQAEYRGSSIVERFVDPNDPTLTTDFATEPNARLDLFYQYRIVNPRRFAP